MRPPIARFQDIPQLMIHPDMEQLARAKAIDGIFPLVTNTALSAKAVLEAYKYHPHIEKRFSGLKSDLQVAQVFLKNNERIEALMLVVYLADLVVALIQRELRQAMEKSGIRTLRTLPEKRPPQLRSGNKSSASLPNTAGTRFFLTAKW